MTLKKILNILLIVIFMTALIPVTSIYASESNDKEVITVGYNARNDIIENIDNKGNEGYGYEILKKVEEISDLKFEFVKIDGEVFDEIQSGEVDIAGLFYDTPERREDFLYMQTPLSAVSAGLMVRMDEEFPFANPSDINGKTVATYEGNLANDYLNDFLEENDISVEYLVGESHNYLEQQADLYLMFSSNKTVTGFTTVLNLAKRNAYIISRYGNEEMLDEINEALHYIILNEGDYFEELAQKYYPGHFSAFHRNLTIEELEVLRQRPLTVAYETNHSPFTAQNTQGEPIGAIVDIMNLLVEKYDFEIIYQPYTVSDPSTYPSHSDIIISAIGTTDYYNKYYTPTESYYSIQMISMVPKDIALSHNSTDEIRKESAKIGVMNYLNANFLLFMEYAVENEFVFYHSFRELLQAYEQGEIDMAVFTQSGTTYANSYLDESDNYTYATDFFLDFHFGIENSIAEEYIPLFNVMLGNISSTDYEKVLIANTSTYFYAETFMDLLSENIHYVVIIVMLTALGFISFAYVQMSKKQEGIAIAYNTDALTGLVAFHQCRSILEDTIKDAKPGEYELISFDIDMFRTINTHYSVSKGTTVIKAISSALIQTFENTKAQITRKTAEQFLILRKINECGTLEEIYSTRIEPAIKEVMGQNYNLSMSFGYVVVEDPTTKASTLIAQADSARNAGKNKHTTTFIKFDQAMKKSYENKVDVTFRMERAMTDKEFYVVYQPKIRFDNLTVGGAEALVRWKPRSGDVIYPDAFISVFEENGFITTLDLFVFEEVCKFIKKNEGKMKIPCISANISATTAMEPNIVSTLHDILKRYNLSPEKIELEITESAMVSDETEIFAKLKHLKNLGFSISIDDFGAGASSLNRLSSLEADVLKLDKEFLRDKDQNKRDFLVVQNIISLAKTLNMSIVAEGVETAVQAKWLKQINCDYAQGYYFERPIDSVAFEELLKSSNTYEISVDQEN